MLNILENGKGEILRLFFKNTDKEYYLREIASILGKSAPSYVRPLDYLVKEGILQDEFKGPLRYFRLNKEYPLYEEIKSIVSKTVGMEFNLKKMVDSVEGIDFAFIFGSVAKNTEAVNSDIDILLLGDKIDRDELVKATTDYEKVLNREINYIVFSYDEFKDKIVSKNSFVLNIINEPVINLKGNIHKHVDEFTKSIE